MIQKSEHANIIHCRKTTKYVLDYSILSIYSLYVKINKTNLEKASESNVQWQKSCQECF